MSVRDSIVEIINLAPGLTGSQILARMGKAHGCGELYACVTHNRVTRRRIKNEKYPYAGTWAYFPANTLALKQ